MGPWCVHFSGAVGGENGPGCHTLLETPGVRKRSAASLTSTEAIHSETPRSTAPPIPSAAFAPDPYVIVKGPDKVLVGSPGTWVLSVDLGGLGGGDATFVFEQEGTAITGTYTGTFGDGVEVAGTLEDGEITFSFDTEAGEIIYTGTVEGTNMSGTCYYGLAGDGTFEGTKSS